MLTKLLKEGKIEEGVLELMTFKDLLKFLVLKDNLVNLPLNLREGDPNYQVSLQRHLLSVQGPAYHLSTYNSHDLILRPSEKVRFI